LQVQFRGRDAGASRLLAELMANIKINGLGLNLVAEGLGRKDKSSLDVVVERWLVRGGCVVIIAQRVAKYDVAEILIGYLIIATPSGNRWFCVNEPMNTTDLSNITCYPGRTIRSRIV
jgi:hypothetical protein